MTLSIGDSKKALNDSLTNNLLIKQIFSNIIIVSLIIVVINIFIVNYSLNNGMTYIKIFIWSFISTSLLLFIHNKIIKLYYIDKNKKEGSEEFKRMMEENTNILIEKKISGENEIESDIVKFLDS